MPSSARRNAFLVAALAVFFWWAFQFAKHDPLLRSINPFAEDPYDAVSSFGAITAAFMAVVSLVRSCFPQWAARGGQAVYLLRVQAAVPFCILVTVAAEMVAMTRHLSMWMDTPGSTRLLMLETSLAALALAALMLLRLKCKTFERGSLIARAIAIWVITLFTLAVYPEQMVVATPGHLLTAVLGDVFLFAPVAAFVKAWLPGTSPATQSNIAKRKGAQRYFAFTVAAAVGMMIGATAYLAEVSENSVRPAAHQMLYVGSVFVGLGAAGMIIGYVFLGRLLGFVVSDQRFSDPQMLEGQISAKRL